MSAPLPFDIVGAVREAIASDPNVSPKYRAVIRPTTYEERLAYKREESAADFQSEQLWRARGGQE